MRQPTRPALHARALAKCYRAGLPGSVAAVHALRGVDLELAPGEILGVTGPAGAGKSTLLLCAAGLLCPDTGTVRWFGEACAPLGRPHGVVHLGERPRYYPFLTAREALEHYAVMHELPGRERGARVAAALARVGLAEHAGTHVRRLSPAMLQRLALAQAIVARARLLLLDDALSALDAAEDADVHALLRTLAADGAAILLAARDARQLAPVADRVVALADGRIRVAGDVALPGLPDRPARVAESRRGA